MSEIRYTEVAALDGCPDLFEAHTLILNHSFLCSLPTKPSFMLTQAEDNQETEAPEEPRSKGAWEQQDVPSHGTSEERAK